MFRNVVFVIFILFYVVASGQEVFRIPAQFKALGNASVSLQSPLGIFSNPAGTASVESISFGVNYENRFLLDELQTASVFIVLPVANSNLGFTFSQFGFHSYHENKWSIGLAKQLGEKFLAGLQFHYSCLFLTENDQRAGALLVDLGLQMRLAESFWVGAQLFNPSEVSFHQRPMVSEFPCVWRVGGHKIFEKAVLFSVEINKWQNQAVGLCAGIELCLKEQLQLRLGIDSRRNLFAMGIGYSIKYLQTDLSFSYHQFLGYTPSFTIYYQLP